MPDKVLNWDAIHGEIGNLFREVQQKQGKRKPTRAALGWWRPEQSGKNADARDEKP